MKYIVDKIRSDLKLDGLSGLLQLLGMLLHSSLEQNVQLLMGIQPALPIPLFLVVSASPMDPNTVWEGT